MKWNRIKEHGKTIGAAVLVLILIWIAAGVGTFEKPTGNAAIANVLSGEALPLLIVLFILLFYIKRRLPGESIDDGDYHLSRYLWPNYAVMFLMMLVCGANASADDVFMYELKAERLLLEDNFEGASRVGEKSMNTSPRLNEMRMYALAFQAKG